MKPLSAVRSTFRLNALGIGLVVALGVVTYVRLTRTTTMGWTGRGEYALLYGLVAGLWMFIAIKCRAGRRWARIAGTVSFAVWSLSAIGDFIGLVTSYLDGWQTAAGLMGLLVWIVGLASVLTMWSKSSGAVFTPADATAR